jgi:hypothetical protein
MVIDGLKPYLNRIADILISMVDDKLRIIPTNIVMEDFVQPAIGYYEENLDKISPYFFIDGSLIKMIGFQQLIVSKKYQLKRDDARSAKGIDYVRECVAQIRAPKDLIKVMASWFAFDLCLTGPSFVNPSIGANIRKSYCRVQERYFDCQSCERILCRDNLLWDLSTIVLDLDADETSLADQYTLVKAALDDLGVDYRIKLSSLKGLHVNVGLPKSGGRTIFERSVHHYCLYKELKERKIPIDDNSLDPVPIIRAPYALHYKRLTPSLPIDDDTLRDGIDALKAIEKLELGKRIPRGIDVVRDWDLKWNVGPSDKDVFDRLLSKWGEKARKAILREKAGGPGVRSEVGNYLGKGNLMTKADEQAALKLLLGEGKAEKLALSIIEQSRKRPPKDRTIPETEKDTRFELQEDIPRRVLELPPPLVFLILDNFTLNEMQDLTGAEPLRLKAQCKNTDEGMSLLFESSRLLKIYPKKWNCKSVYIGGLYSAYKYCSTADTVISVKTEQVWDRDMKILEELEKRLNEGNNELIVAHLLGLDYCKDQGLDPAGAMLILKRFIKSLLENNSNIILTTDHSGEEYVPFFAVLRHEE